SPSVAAFRGPFEEFPMQLPMAYPPVRGYASPSERAIPTRRSPIGGIRAAATASAGLLMVPGLVVATAAPAAAQPACTVEYADLRIVVVVEPQALVTLVISATNPTLACLEVQAADAYVDGIRYAVSELGAIPNAYLYLDLSHVGLLGYDSNLGPTALLAAEVVAGPGGPGFDHVAGFATNVGNYVATEEGFLPDPEATLLGQLLYTSQFFDWSKHVDVGAHLPAVHAALVGAGFPPDMGALVDTGHNGWGGPDRPTEVSTSTDLNTYVDESRLDRRPHRGAWCNQVGAG